MPLYVTSLFNSMYKSNDLPFLDSLHLLSSLFKFDNEDNPMFYIETCRCIEKPYWPQDVHFHECRTFLIHKFLHV